MHVVEGYRTLPLLSPTDLEASVPNPAGWRQLRAVCLAAPYVDHHYGISCSL